MLRRPGTGCTLDVGQAYPSCMKYIQRREFARSEPAPAGSDRRPGPAAVADHLTGQDAALVRAADTMFIATTAPAGTDVSHRSGPPSFIEITGPATVRFADSAGNSMFNTLGNLHLDRRAGLLIPDFGTGDLLHLSGSASADPTTSTQAPGASSPSALAASSGAPQPCPSGRTRRSTVLAFPPATARHLIAGTAQCRRGMGTARLSGAWIDDRGLRAAQWS
jgi:predicted pyridoxine 5'-phosphate oxidase superfamily flavin-nucleotide-binding protein